MFNLKVLFAIVSISVSVSACANSEQTAKQYVWEKVTDAASYPQGYNYPVFVLNGEMLAINNGGWISKDGKTWTKTNLRPTGLNSGYQKYVQLNDGVYALGSIRGNYQDFTITTNVLRTRDGKTWETIARQTNLPERIFYSAAVFKNQIWLVGGYDGKSYFNDVWNSEDAVNWRRATDSAAWSPRQSAAVIVFNDRLWLFGGGVIDGEKEINPDSHKEVWSSADGINWRREQMKTEYRRGGTPIVFDGKLWFIGANRNDGNFDHALTFSDDGLSWQAQAAPWSPRGGVAVWVFDNRLFMTGGKYSFRETNGEIKFVYSNDVWVMRKS
jgi:hypothetical protein